MSKGVWFWFDRKSVPLVGIGLLTGFTLILYKADTGIFFNKMIDFNNLCAHINQRATFNFDWINVTDRSKSLESNLTIVTAYFNIGEFGKGNPFRVRKEQTYLNFARSFRYLMNPVVIYTDSSCFFRLMQTLRANLTSLTKIFLVDKRSSWAFGKRDAIKDIYFTSGYPVYFPNTVVPEYSCAQHAKYDVVARAAKENYFHTDYYAWLDVGLFREERDSLKPFILHPPPGFNSSRIAVCEVANPDMNTSIFNIFRDNLVWVCGCIFIGNREVILKYTEQYKRAVDYFLSQKLMNTDQQVLYAMYSASARREIEADIDLQVYKSNNNRPYNEWFYLGYIMRKFI